MIIVLNLYIQKLLRSFLLRTALIVCSIAVLLVAFIFNSAAQTFIQDTEGISERGLLPIRNYATHDYEAMAQNWSIVQDKRGLIYVANNECILEYDGFQWRKIKLSSDAKVNSLTITEDGVIYVGANNDLGYLTPDSVGKMVFVSLVDKLPKRDRDFGEIWTSCSTPNGIYFQADKRIFRWDGNQFKVWPLNTMDVDNKFHKMFYVRNTLYVRQRGVGLKKMLGDRLVMIQGGEIFKSQDVYFMVPYGEEEILLNTKNRGLLLMKPTPKDYYPKDRLNPEKINYFIPFFTQGDDYFIENKIYCGIALESGFFAIGTEGAGTVIMNSNGKIIHLLNKESGLQDGSVHYQFLDSQNNLWLALGKGVTKVSEINSPISHFDDRLGLSGTVQSTLRHNGTLYVAGLVGLYYLQKPLDESINENGARGSTMSEFKPSKFKKIEDIKTQCWDLISNEKGDNSSLLVASNKGVYEVDNNHNPTLIAKYDPWMMLKSSYDENRVYVAAVDGIGSLYYENGEYRNEDKIDGINENCKYVCEDNNGDLWITTGDFGILHVKLNFTDGKIDPDSTEMIQYDTTHGLPDGYVYAYILNDKLIFTSKKNVYEFKENRFVISTMLGPAFSDGTHRIHRLKEDDLGNYWMETILENPIDENLDIYQIGYVENINGVTENWISTPFYTISKDIVHSIFHDAYGVTWLGGTGGLFQYDMGRSKSYNDTYSCLIRKVILGEDSVAFGGAFYDVNKHPLIKQPLSYLPEVEYNYNSMTFMFSAPSFEDEAALVYSYYLEGFDKDWSNWKKETKANYTNLPEGDYRFRVKAINVYNNESEEAVYGFTILPPWHRTIWAYIAYILGSIGFVLFSIRISTLGLQKIIREKTAEVVMQKEEIELKNKDITDSINYAKKIQEAILPSDTDIKSSLKDSFVLFKPKDIVSGDFYWFTEKDGKALIAAADCTGHGVPGAFMSMIGSSLLNEIVLEKGITKPSVVLQMMKEGVIKALRQTGDKGTQKDGMDIALCTFDLENNKMEYSGAYNSLYSFIDDEFGETRADRMPIGIYHDDGGKTFTNHEFDIKKGDVYYIFTDGYVDQFGGPRGKKFMSKRFRSLFADIYKDDMEAQNKTLDDTIENWKNHSSNTGLEMEQMDDILVIGIRI